MQFLKHQRFLEAIDGQKRAENLIITGVPEKSVLKASGAVEAAETAETDSLFSSEANRP